MPYSHKNQNSQTQHQGIAKVPTQKDSRQIILDLFPDNAAQEITAGDIRQFIQAIYQEKISIYDIIDDLQTADGTKPLSANMGLELADRITPLEFQSSIDRTKIDTNEVDIQKLTDDQLIIEGDIKDVQKRVGTLDQNVQTNQTEIAKIKNTTILNTNEISRIGQSLFNVDNTVNQFTQSILDNTSDISNIKVYNQNHKKDYDALSTKTNQTDAELKKVEKDITKNANNIQQHQRRIKDLEDDDVLFSAEFGQVKTQTTAQQIEIDKNSKAIRDGQPQVNQNKIDVEVAGNKVTNLEIKTSNHENRIVSIEANTTTLEPRVISLERDVAQGFASVASNSKQISELQSTAQKFFTSVIKNANNIGDNIKSINVLSSRMSGYNHNISKNVTSIANNKNRIDSLEQSAQGIKNDITLISGNVSANDTTIKDHSNKLNQHSQRITDNKNESIALTTSLNSAVVHIAQLDTDTKKINQEIVKLGDDINSNQIEVIKLNQEVNTIDHKTSNLSNLVQTNTTKLATVEAGATADMTPGEIKTAYSSNPDVNTFTNKEKEVVDLLSTDKTTLTANIEDMSIWNSNGPARFNLVPKPGEESYLYQWDTQANKALWSIGKFPKSKVHPADLTLSSSGGFFLDIEDPAGELRLRKNGLVEKIVSLETTKDGVVHYNKTTDKFDIGHVNQTESILKVGDISSAAELIIQGHDAQASGVHAFHSKLIGYGSKGNASGGFEIASKGSETVIEAKEGNLILKAWNDVIIDVTKKGGKASYGRALVLDISSVPGNEDSVVFDFASNSWKFRKLDFYNKQEVIDKLLLKANAANVYSKAETYSQSEVNSKEAAINVKIAAKVDTSAVYGKNEVYNKLEMDPKLSAKAEIIDVYTKSYLDVTLANKADANNIYDKNSTDLKLATKMDKTEGVLKTKVYTKQETYSKSEANNLLLNKADKSEYYIKSEIDTKLGAKSDKSDTFSKSTINSKLLNKVDVVAGKQLSEENFSGLEKVKLQKITPKPKPTYTTATTVPDIAQSFNELIDVLKSTGILV